MIRLALPLALGELGWVSMSVVDTMMVGRLGAEAIGAVSIGSSLFILVAIFGIGLMLGLDYLVSHSYGAGRYGDCKRWLLHGIYLALLLALPLTLLAWSPASFLGRVGIEPSVSVLAAPYLELLALSILPLLFYSALRRYLQAVGSPGIITFALISANVVNALANWVLIFGAGGLPALGVKGAAWATLISRVYLVVVLAGRVLRQDREAVRRLTADSLRPEAWRLKELVRLGFPAALQLSIEVGVFTLATALAGLLDAVSLAAHQVALSTASFTFMVPLGISSAGAVLVGQALGREAPEQARSAGNVALVLGAGFMLTASLALIIFPRWIVRAYTPEADVIALGIPLLGVAAVFQVFDGLQVVATGVLRGTGETLVPVIANLICHWLIGLPIGYFLCFTLGVGILGLWIGLSVGLIVVGISLTVHWRSRIARLTRRFRPRRD